MRVGANLTYVSQYNENAVFHALRSLGPTSQTDIAAHTGLSIQTVSAIVKNLKTRGYLRELRTESVGRGRPRVILDLVANARYAVGIHVDPTIMTVVLLDLQGSVVLAVSSGDVDPQDPDRSMDVAGGLVRQVIEGSGVDPAKVIGACLAVPGPLDATAQAIVDTVWMPGWNRYPLGKALEHRIGMSVPVVKDTLAAVIGESWVRGGESLESTMIFVYVGTGTGVGVSLNGEPVRGSSGNVGEVGRILLTLGSGPDGVEDGLGNDPAVLVERAHSRGILRGPAPARSDLNRMEREFRELCRLADGRHAGARELLESAARRIAEMVVMTTELFDADTVVFGGPYWDLVRDFYEPAAVAALERPSARGPHPVAVFSTAMGTGVGAIGAASVVLDARYVPRAPRRV